jgi:hypothetical protein
MCNTGVPTTAIRRPRLGTQIGSLHIASELCDISGLVFVYLTLKMLQYTLIQIKQTMEKFYFYTHPSQKLVSIGKTTFFKWHFYNFTKVKAPPLLPITIVPSGAPVHSPRKCTGSQINLSVLESVRNPDPSIWKMGEVNIGVLG